MFSPVAPGRLRFIPGRRVRAFERSRRRRGTSIAVAPGALAFVAVRRSGLDHLLPACLVIRSAASGRRSRSSRRSQIARSIRADRVGHDIAPAALWFPARSGTDLPSPSSTWRQEHRRREPAPALDQPSPGLTQFPVRVRATATLRLPAPACSRRWCRSTSGWSSRSKAAGVLVPAGALMFRVTA